MVAFNQPNKVVDEIEQLADIAQEQIQNLSCEAVIQLLKLFEQDCPQKSVVVIPSYLEDFLEKIRAEFVHVVIVYSHKEAEKIKLGLRGDVSELTEACALVVQVSAIACIAQIEQALRNEGCNDFCHILMTAKTA